MTETGPDTMITAQTSAALLHQQLDRMIAVSAHWTTQAIPSTARRGTSVARAKARRLAAGRTSVTACRRADGEVRMCVSHCA
jgi:hypothetical protein